MALDTYDNEETPDFHNVQRDVAKQGMTIELQDGLYYFYPIPDRELTFQDLDKFWMFYRGFINGWNYGFTTRK